MTYNEIYRDLGLPVQALAIATGSLSLPGYYPVFDCGGFPPALLPIARTESGIVIGYWKHWLVPDRNLTIVEHYGYTMFGNYFITTEYARNFMQLMHIYLLNMITRDEGVDAATIAIANDVGIADIDMINLISETTGDDAAGLLRLECFRVDPPYSCFDNDANYPGDFPHPAGIEIDPTRLRSACGYEIHSRFGQGQPDPLGYRKKVGMLPDSPIWLQAADQQSVFTELLKCKDHRGAWMSLNSLGWNLEDAIVAIVQLAEYVNNPQFSRYASFWISQAQGASTQSY